MSELKYRPDIDGLRAIAVLSVVMFHAGVQAFSGGFCGVDIFFMISGYLITSIIEKEICLGNFSIVTFYERRVRRILPAFFAVAVFSSIMAFVLMLPNDFESYSKSLIASALSGSNILFWRESGYFDSSSELKPLLHTWSLGIEEQFYIILPIFLLAIPRKSKWHLGWCITLIALVSFAASVWGTEHKPDATFYLAPTRAWELSLGALLALNVIPAIHHQYLREIVALSGWVLIAFGVMMLTPDSTFPGINALLPCVGAALIIHAGSGGQSAVGRLLSWRPFLLIGLISYSLYLWYWPLLVFAKYYAVRPLTPIETMIVLLLAVAVSIASWHFVERPFRKRKKMISRRAVFVGGIAITLVAAAFGFAVLLAEGWPSRFSDDVLKLANGALDQSASSMGCMEKNRLWSDSGEFCFIGQKESDPSFIVLGDSHADALMPGVDLVARKRGKKGVHAAFTSCAPLDGISIRHFEEDLKCVEFRNKMLAFTERSSSIQNVVLIARWSVYSEGTRYGRDDVGPKIFLDDEKNQGVGNHEDFLIGIERTVMRMRRANKQVFIVFSVPEVGLNVPSNSSRNLLFGHNMDIRPKITDFFERNKYVAAVMDRMALQYGVHVIYPHSILCGTGSYCSTIKDGKSLYADDDHLNVFGAEVVSAIFEPIFKHST